MTASLQLKHKRKQKPHPQQTNPFSVINLNVGNPTMVSHSKLDYIYIIWHKEHCKQNVMYLVVRLTYLVND